MGITCTNSPDFLFAAIARALQVLGSDLFVCVRPEIPQVGREWRARYKLIRLHIPLVPFVGANGRMCTSAIILDFILQHLLGQLLPKIILRQRRLPPRPGPGIVRIRLRHTEDEGELAVGPPLGAKGIS